MPTLDYLLGEITVDNPHGDRDRALEANPGMLWPEEHWAVSDEQLGYLAFFRFEEDAWSFRLYLINLRQNGAVAARRYAKADKAVDKREAEELEKLEKDLQKNHKRREKLFKKMRRYDVMAPEVKELLVKVKRLR